jgi:hypothetical protein
MARLSRRIFLQVSGAVALVPGAAETAQGPASPAQAAAPAASGTAAGDTYLFFNAPEAAFIEAAVRLTVGLPVSLAPAWFKLPRGAGRVLTWGGLRGGISVALALSVPEGAGREALLPLTYAVVVFSVLVQGLLIGRVVTASMGSDKGQDPVTIRQQLRDGQPLSNR